jgi:hypothetical protein
MIRNPGTLDIYGYFLGYFYFFLYLRVSMGMSLNTDTPNLTRGILSLIAELDEFKGACPPVDAVQHEPEENAVDQEMKGGISGSFDKLQERLHCQLQSPSENLQSFEKDTRP